MIPFNPFWFAPPLDLLARYFPQNPIAHYESAPPAHMGPFEVQPFQLFDFATPPPQPHRTMDEATSPNPHNDPFSLYSNNPYDWSNGYIPPLPNFGLYSNSNYTGGPTGPMQNVNWGFNLGPWQWDMGHYSQPYDYPPTSNNPSNMSMDNYGPNISLKPSQPIPYSG